MLNVTGHTDRPSTNWRGRDDNTARGLVDLLFIERGRRSFRHVLKLTARQRGPHSSGRLARPLVRPFSINTLLLTAHFQLTLRCGRVLTVAA